MYRYLFQSKRGEKTQFMPVFNTFKDDKVAKNSFFRHSDVGRNPEVSENTGYRIKSGMIRKPYSDFCETIKDIARYAPAFDDL